MRSVLLTEGQPKNFFADIALLESFPRDALQKVLTVFATATRESRAVNSRDLLELLVTTSHTVEDVEKIIRVATYIEQHVRSTDDTHELIVQDLSSIGKVESAEALLHRLKDFASRYGEAIAPRASQALLTEFLNTLDSITTRNITIVDVEPEFDSDVDTPKSYKIETTTPVSAVMLKITYRREGKRESLTIAASPAKLKELIDHLQLAVAQAAQLPSGSS